LAPAFGLATGVFVADEDCRTNFFEEFFEGVVGVTAEDEANAALFGVFFDVAQALLRKW